MPTLVQQRTVSAEGLEFIASFEGFRADLYNDPVGHATIGYGHLVHLGPINGSEPAEFKKPLTRQQALDLLREDAERFVTAVHAAVSVPLSQGQFDALVSFAFNVGAGNLRASTLLRRVNDGDYIGAATEFSRWTMAGGVVLPGLVRRRTAEARMFGAVLPAQSLSLGTATVELQLLRPGLRNDHVRMFQNALRRKGFAHLNPSGATGLYGDQTCSMCSAAHQLNRWTVPDPDLPDAQLVAWLDLRAT